MTFAAMAATVYFRWQFQGVLGERGLYSTFLPSVIIAAHFGGLWPGLVATIASVLVTNSLLVGHLLHLDAKTAGDTLAMLVFAGTGGVISLLSESLHRVQGRRIQMEQERRAQLTIQRTEERFTHLMLHSSDIIGVFSPDGTILYQTPSVVRILGYPASQRIGQNVLSDPIVHPDDRESQRGFLASILDQPGTPIRSELRLRHANGTWRDFEAIGQVLMDDPGAVVLIANYRDITDRKAAENAIQDSEQRWRSLVQTLPQLIWTTNPRGMGTYFSPQFLEFCGQSTEAFLNSGWHRVVHPDDLAGVIERWKKAVDAGGAYLHEHRIRRADGAYHWFRVHAIPVRDPAGRVVRWLGSCTDVTDLKQSARELLAARDTAESANRAKDEFLANVSHEIRTPLNAILGMTDLVLDSPLEAQQRNLLTTVKAAGANLMEIVNDLLDFSKLAAGKLVLHSAPFPLRTVVQESIQLLATRAAEQGIELRCDIGSDVPEHVVGDAVRLRQILLNLLMNGIKFTPRGSVSLSVERRPAWQADCAVVEFRVRDTGIGISPEKQELIFKAFEQEDSTTTRRFGGTGLGLTISSRLVQA
ncbi:MAG TPA: PAS domain S-box protein, partial [Caulifigura sp.]|nr:PAS domain S-box protein [Caulifigura sp.]